MSFQLWHIMAFAFLVALAASGFMRALNITDAPNARSSHTAPTPTAGGIGIVAGLAAALIALRLFYPEDSTPAVYSGLAGLGLLIAALGFLDDRFVVPTKLKFILIGLIAAATPYVTGVPAGLPGGTTIVPLPYIAGYIGAALWMFVVINAVNFMDGANGLMGLFMMIASAGLCAASVMTGNTQTALLAGSLAAGLAGFLPYNARRKAVIFCGDTGALFTGFLFAAAALLYGQGDSRLLYAGPILMMPFLVDVLCTILLRASRGENILQAHRSHLYHIMLLRGASHLRVAFIYALWAVMMVLITLIGISTGLITLMTFLLLITIFGCWRWVRARRQMEQSLSRQNPR